MSRIIVPTLSPTALLTAGSDYAASGKYTEVVREDFAKALRLTISAPTWDEAMIFDSDAAGRPWRLYPTETEAVEFFAPFFLALKMGEQPPVLTVDVETSGEHPLSCKLLCVGLGYVDDTRKERVINVPFHVPGGARYWRPEHEEAVRFYMGLVLADPRIVKSFHNGSFDTVVLGSHGLPVNGWREDTMVLAHITDSELPLNLGFVASRYTDSRYWKDDVKGEQSWVDKDATVLRSYNLRDVLVTMRVRGPLTQTMYELSSKLTFTYENELRCSQIMARATTRGVLVDMERRDSRVVDASGRPVGLGPQLEQQRDRAIADLRVVAGADFDPAKPQQVRDLLYRQLKFPESTKLTASGLPGTDKEALMLLDQLADTPEQRQVLTNISLYRQADKFLSTFVRGLSTLSDGRFHPSWGIRTTSGRFVSSPNFQNLPTRIKKIFRAAPGRKLVGIDLSQAELRLIAYLANEPTLLQMYRDDINVHTVNASLLFRVRCPPEAADPKINHINPQTEAYIRAALPPFLGLKSAEYDTWPVVPMKKWKSVRTLAKNAEFGCLAADTKVAVLDDRGSVPICEVRPGDWTWCWNGTQYEQTRVKKAWCTGVKRVVRLTMRSDTGVVKTMVLTPGHRVVLRDGSKAEVGTLKPGARLMPFRRYTMKTGYREIDPRNDGGRAYEHRQVLGDGGAKHVHHLNHRRDDNRPENLAHVTTKEHRSHHPIVWGEEGRRQLSENAKRQWKEGRVAADLSEKRAASPAWQRAVRDPARWTESLAKAQAVTLANRREAAAQRGPCVCGGAVYAKGLCKTCYHRDYWRRSQERNHTVVSVEPLETPVEVWDLEVEHTAHNFAIENQVFVSNSCYGAMPETVHGVLRAKRDPETLKLLFPGLPLTEIEAINHVWRTKLRTGVVAYWDRIQAAIRATGFYQCPISGRVRRFRDGFKRNEMLNVSVQMGVASWMNLCMVTIQGQFDRETGGDALIVQQVHDALTADCDESYAHRAGEVMQAVCSQPFDLTPHGYFANAQGAHRGARLPADAALIGTYLDET